jgi:hypothetical protein
MNARWQPHLHVVGRHSEVGKEAAEEAENAQCGSGAGSAARQKCVEIHGKSENCMLKC